jgi:hypothetical protein
MVMACEKHSSTNPTFCRECDLETIEANRIKVGDYVMPFDQLNPAFRTQLIDAYRDMGEGPGELSTTEVDAVDFFRTLNEDELAIWVKSCSKS